MILTSIFSQKSPPPPINVYQTLFSSLNIIGGGGDFCENITHMSEIFLTVLGTLKLAGKKKSFFPIGAHSQLRFNPEETDDRKHRHLFNKFYLLQHMAAGHTNIRYKLTFLSMDENARRGFSHTDPNSSAWLGFHYLLIVHVCDEMIRAQFMTLGYGHLNFSTFIIQQSMELILLITYSYITFYIYILNIIIACV